MNFAVIGSFWLTENMIEAMRRTPGATYFAHYSRTLERAGEFSAPYGNIRLYDDLDRLAADPDVDAVYIASPNYAHYNQAKTLLSAGKHVLCEKPVCYTRAQYDELRAIADNRGVAFMEAIMNIHQPHFAALKAALAVYGRVISARLDFSQRSSKLDRVLAGEKFSTFQKETGGGALMDLGVYALYLAVGLFGRPQRIDARADFFETGVDGCDHVLLDYGDFCAALTFTKLAESRIHSEILCQSGSAVIGNLSRLQDVVLYDGQGSATILHKETTFPDGMCAELADFLDLANSRTDGTQYDNLAREVLSCMEEIRRQIGYEI